SCANPTWIAYHWNIEDTMKQNMGTVDRIIRIVAALAIAVLAYVNLISGTVAIVLGVLAVVFIATSFVGFCPLYLPFGLSTRPKE
ncbi:MAG TPA: DUF2892 domain-containing protein, partial [Leptospiraceae bacterium]|nr:DUF2892 domain-containing protein [Leptospiraceae bacterium]